MQATGAREGDETVSNLTAAWIAKGASTLDRPAPAPPEPPPPPVWSPPPQSNDAAAHQVDLEELLRWGQQAARAGDRLVAYRLFVRALEVDPTNEYAWLWRAGTCDRSEEAIRCLEQVLLINPNNERARRGLSESKRRLAGL
jgi:tetratricopeptide (TPR) repeat protein